MAKQLISLNASSAEQLAIAGTSPIVVVMDGADISTGVSNTNSDATLWLAGADTDPNSSSRFAQAETEKS